MKTGETNATKELYRELRRLSCERLWAEEVPRFDRATPDERAARVALVRAVGVVFSESGTQAQREAVRPWLLRLLQDPSEKIRRYAMTALPKIGAGQTGEAELLSLLRSNASARERKFVGRTLEKIGGKATLEVLHTGKAGPAGGTEQKVRATLARNESPSTVRTEVLISDLAGLGVHLRGRRGLEALVRAEVEASPRTKDRFRVAEVDSGLVALTPIEPFSLDDIYSLRCFGTAGLALGSVNEPGPDRARDALAGIIASPRSRRLLHTLTQGPIRYRLDFVEQGHQRGAVRAIADRAYALCPDILNDPRQAPWVVRIHPSGAGSVVELNPRLIPDPRFSYRQHDVPAASHPPLAACMARVAGPMEGEIVWDPFCGSGVELVERSLLGGVRRAIGTDLNREAIRRAGQNFAAASLGPVESTFLHSDFRNFARLPGLGFNSATLVLSNPPMGKRVPIPDLPTLIAALFRAADAVLKPGGRLVFANPLRMECPVARLKLHSRQAVDFGGFECRLEKYVKSAHP